MYFKWLKRLWGGKNRLKDGIYKIPYDEVGFYIVKDNMVKFIPYPKITTIRCSGIYFPTNKTYEMNEYFIKYLVPMSSEEKIELL